MVKILPSLVFFLLLVGVIFVGVGIKFVTETLDARKFEKMKIAKMISSVLVLFAVAHLVQIQLIDHSIASNSGGTCAPKNGQPKCGNQPGTKGQSCSATNPCADKCFNEKDCSCTGPSNALCSDNGQTRNCAVETYYCNLHDPDINPDGDNKCAVFSSGFGGICGNGSWQPCH
ncbi:MAG: hypothetical protein CMO55_11335 [Verrucomicrobiales bacterium]|nr:hypothetical protein [Verrucomicrobiales bacterium]